jgi:hypothetical protein
MDNGVLVAFNAVTTMTSSGVTNDDETDLCWGSCATQSVASGKPLADADPAKHRPDAVAAGMTLWTCRCISACRWRCWRLAAAAETHTPRAAPSMPPRHSELTRDLSYTTSHNALSAAAVAFSVKQLASRVQSQLDAAAQIVSNAEVMIATEHATSQLSREALAPPVKRITAAPRARTAGIRLRACTSSVSAPTPAVS